MANQYMKSSFISHKLTVWNLCDAKTIADEIIREANGNISKLEQMNYGFQMEVLDEEYQRQQLICHCKENLYQYQYLNNGNGD